MIRLSSQLFPPQLRAFQASAVSLVRCKSSAAAFHPGAVSSVNSGCSLTPANVGINSGEVATEAGVNHALMALVALTAYKSTSRCWQLLSQHTAQESWFLATVTQ